MFSPASTQLVLIQRSRPPLTGDGPGTMRRGTVVSTVKIRKALRSAFLLAILAGPAAPAGAMPPVPPDATRFSFDHGAELYVDIAGPHAKDSHPKWDMVLNAVQVRFNVVGTTRAQPVHLSFDNFAGRAGLLFAVDGLAATCIATITDAPGPVLIGPKPRTFALHDFHAQGPGGPCTSRMGRLVFDWHGRMTLSADADGNIRADIELQYPPQKGDRGISIAASGVTAKNLQSPTILAGAEASRKEALATAEVARKEALAAMELPPPDVKPFEWSGKAGKLTVVMTDVDDIGVVAIGNAQGKWTSGAAAEWTIDRPGSDNSDITRLLTVGDNWVVFLLHNKRFQFGPGKWGFDFSLLADGRRVWSDAKQVGGGSVGIRYWKPFVVKKAANGALNVRAATAEEASPILARMKKTNEWLIATWGNETSVGKALAGAATQALAGSMAPGGGSGTDSSWRGMDANEANADVRQRQAEAAARAREREP